MTRADHCGSAGKIILNTAIHQLTVLWKTWIRYRANTFELLTRQSHTQPCWTNRPLLQMQTVLNEQAASANANKSCWIHRCRKRHICGGAKDFCPNSLKVARK